MNTLEDKVRLALRDTGEEISPHSVPPLRLRGTGRARLPRIPGRWGTWLAPLAAAAAVAAVVATSLAISATFHGHAHGNGSGPALAAPAHRAPLGPASALHLVPPYFVALSGHTRSEGDYRAVVRSTVTGRTLATVTPPQPYQVFTWVSGAADDRTFVLAAQRYWYIASGQAGLPAESRDNTTATVFFKLTFAPRTRSVQLTRLAVPGLIRSSDLAGMAVSPDGTRLALDLRQSIRIVRLATGATQTWTWPGSGWIGNWKSMGQTFSWSSGGRYLAFQQWGEHFDEGMNVRMLDTTAPGTSLGAATVILMVPYNAGNAVTGNSFLTPDGTKVVAAASYSPQGPPSGYSQVTEYSARTGRPVLAEDLFSGSVGWQEVLWAGPHGNALVVSDPRGKKTQYGHNNVLGVLAGNKFTPIPHGADNYMQLAW
jgi:hypothetical protein